MLFCNLPVTDFISSATSYIEKKKRKKKPWISIICTSILYMLVSSSLVLYCRDRSVVYKKWESDRVLYSSNRASLPIYPFSRALPTVCDPENFPSINFYFLHKSITWTGELKMKVIRYEIFSHYLVCT